MKWLQKSTFLTIVFLVIDTAVNTDKVKNLERSSKIKDQSRTPARSIAKTDSTYVVNHEFCFICLSAEDLEEKDTLEEVHTYARLKNDPRADLPSSFTICSSVMTTYGSMQRLFNLLGNDGNSWLESFLSVDVKTSFNHWNMAKGKLPPVFAYQWVRSCMAVNSESGLLQWVVDGILIENATVPHLRETKIKPTDLTGKIVLGAWQQSGSKKWTSRISNQVTNLNIFSTAITVGEMQQHTMGGKCTPDGDYLAWKDMQWNLRGQAVIETVDEKEPCMGHPFLNIYPNQYHSMESCSHFCQNLGSRSPPLVTLQQWTNLQATCIQLL